MTYLADIADWSILAVALLLFAIQWIAYEAGGWLGRRYAARNESPPEGVGVVVGGLLGLLAFVLALTLSYANNRFAERRAGTSGGRFALLTMGLYGPVLVFAGRTLGESLSTAFLVVALEALERTERPVRAGLVGGLALGLALEPELARAWEAEREPEPARARVPALELALVAVQRQQKPRPAICFCLFPSSIIFL